MATQKKHLVIVESPTKAKTIGTYLGSRYKVIASAGHLRDLPKSRMAVDLQNGFSPEYINVRGKGDLIKEIKSEAKLADKVYLATDPDREGEAISWHICQLLGIDPEKANRIEFPEITKAAVKRGIENPRAIDMDLVDAQQGRRVMDRIVGYSISPVLWSKVARGLSAGRVQSSALKIICDREVEIRSFIPKEYWLISGSFTKQGLTPAQEKKNSFSARLTEYKGKKLELADKPSADMVLKALKSAEFAVNSVENKQRVKKPFAPYTTSTLQQDASIKLGFSSKETMALAQRLYETGRITYMRTDSVRISAEADAACKEYIKLEYSDAYVGSNFYTNKSKGAQDAHEAIRPSDVNLTPEKLSGTDVRMAKLYKLIWSRFVASRMKPAIYDTRSVEIKADDYGFRANGSSLVFDGYLRAYDDGEKPDKALPPLEKGEILKPLSVEGEQRFTEPPSRFSEASLIKELEENGVGRPSTYAATIANLIERKYVKREKKALVATALGEKVTYDIMVPYFNEVVDIKFTAQMEEDLDMVEAGKKDWREVVGDCYNGYLKREVDSAMKEVEKQQSELVLTGENCPMCGKPLAVKQSRFGEFIACTGYPECRYTQSIVKSTGVKCPKCGGDIIVRRSKKGKTFYGCSNYPKCNQVYWDKPVQEACPKCGSLLVVKGSKLSCSNPDCKFSKNK